LDETTSTSATPRAARARATRKVNKGAVTEQEYYNNKSQMKMIMKIKSRSKSQSQSQSTESQDLSSTRRSREVVPRRVHHNQTPNDAAGANAAASPQGEKIVYE
jgi:hypothetical protein